GAPQSRNVPGVEAAVAAALWPPLRPEVGEFAFEPPPAQSVVTVEPTTPLNGVPGARFGLRLLVVPELSVVFEFRLLLMPGLSVVFELRVVFELSVPGFVPMPVP